MSRIYTTEKNILIFFMFWVAVVGFCYLLKTTLSADDDNFCLYKTTHYLSDKKRVQEVTADVRQRLIYHDASRSFLERFDVFDANGENFLIPTTVYLASKRFIDFVDNNFVRLSQTQNMGMKMVFMFLCSFVSALFWPLFALKKASRMRFYIAFFIVLCLTAVMTHYYISRAFPGATVHFFKKGSIEFVLGSLMSLFTTASDQYSMLGYTPRNNFILVLLAVFIFRWSGNFRFSYPALLFAFLYHHPLGIVFTGLIVATDLLCEPSHLKEATSWVPLTLIVLIALLRTRLIELFLADSFPGVILAGALIGISFVIAAGVKWKDGPIRGFWRFVQSQRDRLKNKGMVFSDVLSLLFLWAVTLPIAMLMYHYSEDFQKVYLWGQLHGRILAVFNRALFFAVVLGIMGYIDRKLKESNARDRVRAAIIRCVVLCVCLFSVHIISKMIEKTERHNLIHETLMYPLNRYESRLYRPYRQTLIPKMPMEAFVQYVTVRSIEDGRDYYRMVLPLSEEVEDDG